MLTGPTGPVPLALPRAFLFRGAMREDAAHARLAARGTGPADAPKPRLLDRVREAIRARRYSLRRADEVLQ